jgi:hypothetical protein
MLSDQQIRTAVAEALSPGRFFVSAADRLRIVHAADEDVAWEIFRGHLLDASRTRQRRTFEAWNVFLVGPADEAADAPRLSIKLDVDEGRLFVTRNILMYGWEAYEQAPGVIASRPAQKWMPELVGTLDLGRFDTTAALRVELSTYVLLAVIGTSRLPITSIEAPLPAFMLGELAYLPHATAASQPLTDPRSLVEQMFCQGGTSDTSLVNAKLLEAALRATDAPGVAALADALIARCRACGESPDEISHVLVSLFNHVALSPYTSFVDHLVALLVELSISRRLGHEPVIDVVSYMLRHLVRHLTAFDLVRFHNLGANYPDALLLDALLKLYLTMIDEHAASFELLAEDNDAAARGKRRRRRALRQAWLIRKQYEGHRVPDAPTSPGENLQVLPQPFARVPDEQIARPEARRKQLYAGQPLEPLLTESAHRVLRQSIDDLSHAAELRELGMAVFLDRPLGIFKQPGEADRTPLLSYEAFSREIAERRVRELARHELIADDVSLDNHIRRLNSLSVQGFPASRLPGTPRPGVVALEDAQKAAIDFVFIRTTRQSLSDLLSHYDFQTLADAAPPLAEWLHSDRDVLLIRSAASADSFMTAFDCAMQPRLKFSVACARNEQPRYVEVAGREHLADGLRVSVASPSERSQDPQSVLAALRP